METHRASLLVLLAGLLLVGCGEYTQTSERYIRRYKVPGSDFSKRVGPLAAHMVIEGTYNRSGSRSMWRDSEGTLGPPYNLYIVGLQYEPTEDPFTILEATLIVDPAAPVPLITADAPVQVPFGEFDGLASTSHGIDLSPYLDFQADRDVVVEARLRVPDSGEELSIRTIYRGTRTVTPNSKLETMLLGG